MKLKYLTFLAIIFTLISCEYSIDGSIRNLTNDTIKVTLVVDLRTRNQYNRTFDSATYEKLVRKEGYKNVQTNWSKGKSFTANFRVLSKDSVEIFGGLGPATPSDIYFDTITIATPRDTIAYFGEKEILKKFKKYEGEQYRLDIMN